jgi:hypothetical protein
MIKVGSSNCVNVPMLYAAFMDTSTGSYERYQCDSGAMPIRQAGVVTQAAELQMATNELLLCMDINIISTKGVIKTHIPPTVCPALKGYVGTQKPSSGATQDYMALKAALTSLMKAYGASISPFTTVVVQGPYNAFTAAETKLVLSDLFGINYNSQPLKAESQSDKGSETRVKLNPPQLFIDEQPVAISVPS